MATILVHLQNRNGASCSQPIQARWRGKNTAVHASMVHRNDIEGVGPATKETRVHFRWRLTHLATGLSAAKFMYLVDAMRAAKIFDSLFIHDTGEEMKANKELIELFTEDVRNNGGFLC